MDMSDSTTILLLALLSAGGHLVDDPELGRQLTVALACLYSARLQQEQHMTLQLLEWWAGQVVQHLGKRKFRSALQIAVTLKLPASVHA